MTVFGYFVSFCTQKVYLALAEKRVRYSRRSVNIGPPMENYEPWYARINPRMVIPTLQHGEHLVCDSAKIIRYIDEHFEGPGLLPQDKAQAQQVLRWVDRIDALEIRELSYSALRGLMTTVRDRVIMPRRLRLLRKHMAAAPELRAIYQARIDDVQMWMRTLKTPPELEAAHAELIATVDELEHATSAGAFVVGDSYTLADLMATVLVARLKLMKLAHMSGRPNLAAHYARMRAREGFPSDDIVDEFSLRRKLQIAAPLVAPVAVVLLCSVGLLVWLLAGR